MSSSATSTPADVLLATLSLACVEQGFGDDASLAQVLTAFDIVGKRYNLRDEVSYRALLATSQLEGSWSIRYATYTVSCVWNIDIIALVLCY